MVVRPERRTRADLAAVALLLAVAVAGAFVLWRGSDIRATDSQTATPPPGKAPALAEVPGTFTETWRAPSPATPKPVVAAPNVVTGEGNQVLGRDPITGAVLWHYVRDLPLCTIAGEWDRAIAVFHKSHNCSEVTSLEGGSGKRGPQRNSDADFGTQLLTDGTHVTATGNRIIETWRSDLVRTQQYGVPDAWKNAGNNLRRPQCRYTSTAVGDDRVGVIEKCPGEPNDRITTMKSRPQDDEKPEETLSTVTSSTRANVVATSKNRAAVVLRDRSQLTIFRQPGSVDAEFPVRTGPGNPSGVEQTTTSDMTFWYTGVDTVALDSQSLHPVWTAQDTLGPGVQMGGRILIPVAGGIAVHDPRTGLRERVIPLDRQGYRGPVTLETAGNVLLEQRGDTLVALH